MDGISDMVHSSRFFHIVVAVTVPACKQQELALRKKRWSWLMMFLMRPLKIYYQFPTGK